MASEDHPTTPDPDDWFSEPDVTESLREQPSSSSVEVVEVDDWLDESDVAAPRRRRRSGGGGNDARIAIAVGIGLVALLLIGLAIGGVFSSGKSSPPAPLFTITTHPSTTTTKTSTTPSNVAAPTTALKPGDTGAQVKALQRALAHLGHSPGTIDGAYGPSTTAAVKSFQTAHGLTADGVAGPKTIAALKNALNSG